MKSLQLRESWPAEVFRRCVRDDKGEILHKYEFVKEAPTEIDDEHLYAFSEYDFSSQGCPLVDPSPAKDSTVLNPKPDEKQGEKPTKKESKPTTPKAETMDFRPTLRGVKGSDIKS